MHKREGIVLDRAIIRRNNEYYVIEEILNPGVLKLKANESNDKEVYREGLIIYNDANTGNKVDLREFNGCEFVNTANMCDESFLNTDFFVNNRMDILITINSIIQDNKRYKMIDLKNKTYNKLLKSREFITSDFAKEHYNELFETLRQISINKEKQGKSKKKIKR